MSHLLSTLPTALVATIHTYIFVLESFLWTTPRGMKAFGLTPAYAAQTRVLALNQGVYNGFLAAGLAWGLSKGSAGKEITLFFLGCVGIAGVVGGATVKSKVFFIQTLPAAIAAAALVLA